MSLHNLILSTIFLFFTTFIPSSIHASTNIVEGKWVTMNEYLEFYEDHTVQLNSGGMMIAGKWIILRDGRVKIEFSLLGSSTIMLGTINDNMLSINEGNTIRQFFKTVSGREQPPSSFNEVRQLYDHCFTSQGGGFCPSSKNNLPYCLRLNHPSVEMGYRLEAMDRSVKYMSLCKDNKNDNLAISTANNYNSIINDLDIKNYRNDSKCNYYRVKSSGAQVCLPKTWTPIFLLTNALTLNAIAQSGCGNYKESVRLQQTALNIIETSDIPDKDILIKEAKSTLDRFMNNKPYIDVQ